MNSALPILYSFRRCPYAIRARLALAYSEILVELREVQLKNKPACMLERSPKGTVPVLALPDGLVIDESLDIMIWALRHQDKFQWYKLDPQLQKEILELIALNDIQFKPWLDRYKYAVGYPENSQGFYRSKCEEFIEVLEGRLQSKHYLISNNITLADIAIFPFIRQFAYVDINWFELSGYDKVNLWLSKQKDSELFKNVMQKHAFWKSGDEKILLPNGK